MSKDKNKTPDAQAKDATEVVSIDASSSFDSLLKRAKDSAKEAANKKYTGEINTAIEKLKKARDVNRTAIVLANDVLAKETAIYEETIANIKQQFKDYLDIVVD